jgi:hypothetical protein
VSQRGAADTWRRHSAWNSPLSVRPHGGGVSAPACRQMTHSSAMVRGGRWRRGCYTAAAQRACTPPRGATSNYTTWT